MTYPALRAGRHRFPVICELEKQHLTSFGSREACYIRHRSVITSDIFPNMPLLVRITPVPLLVGRTFLASDPLDHSRGSPRLLKPKPQAILYPKRRVSRLLYSVTSFLGHVITIQLNINADYITRSSCDEMRNMNTLLYEAE